MIEWNSKLDKIAVQATLLVILSIESYQTSANTSTWYRYSSKIHRFINYLCMNL